MSGVLAGAAASASAVAYGGFKYNRMNYLFDNSMRFGRYTSGYSMAIEQASMYREDIRDMTALTVTKQDTYHVVGVIFFVLNFQLIMAGRLGVHGPSPPGWILGLYWSNVCTALMFLVTYTWLAMHASARATAGGAYMLTRSVRLPIPTPKQLDKARVTGNSFERTRMTDMFRVPFAVPAPKESVAADEDSADSDGSSPKKAPKSGAPSVPISNRRIPRWYQQDEVKDLYGGAGKTAPGQHATPEHFELYRGLQQEWWGHDVYARIGMLYFMSHWLTSVSIYSQCHCFGELRAMWPAWSVTLVFCTAHAAILRADIVSPPRRGQWYEIPVENIAPWTPVITVLGMSLDYSVITPSSGWIALIYVLSWICYIIHVAWAIRLCVLAMPVQGLEQPESPGQPWWPKEWWLPPAFAHMVYLVAPPKQLEPGQTCLQQEMKAAKSVSSATAPIKKARETLPALFPWKIFRGALFTMTATWTFICIGRFIEHLNGERMFLKQEGRVERWPSHMQPWMAPWTRFGTRNEYCHTGGCDRRLGEQFGEHAANDGQRQRQVASVAQRLANILGPLAEALERPVQAATLPAVVGQPLAQGAKVRWPFKMRPALLTSGGGDLVAALARTHRGAMVSLAPQHPTGGEVLYPFILEGLDGLGELMGASWGRSGLLLTTASGVLAECAGLPVSGVWPCSKVGATLPLGGSSLHAAVAARIPGTGQLRAAVAFAGDPSIALFDADDATTSWLPAGEVEAPFHMQTVPLFSMSSTADELLISAGSGAVLKWRVGETEPVVVPAPQVSSATSTMVWHAVCSLGGDRIAHLASRTNQGSDSLPELFVSTKA